MLSQEDQAAVKSLEKPPPEGGNKWVGKSIQRLEETRLVQGQGMFVDDYKMEGMLYVKIVRSPYAHAKIERLDVSKAAAAPGVICTLTGREVAELSQPFPEIGPGVVRKLSTTPWLSTQSGIKANPWRPWLLNLELRPKMRPNW